MIQWPHAPIHLLDEAGTFMVTAGTYQKQKLFDTPDKTQMLHDALLGAAADSKWALQAWAVMSNHYHFVAISPEAASTLAKFIAKLHMTTAKQLNRMDETPGRRVWFQYWDVRITYEQSFLARLNYVHHNPAHHGVVANSVAYPWCSASWFERTADKAFYNNVCGRKTDKVRVMDDF